MISRTPQLYMPAPLLRANFPRIGCLSGSRGRERPKLRLGSYRSDWARSRLGAPNLRGIFIW
jgi:hypothetical protein